MKAIERRVKGIEDKLYMGEGQKGRLIIMRAEGDKQLPEPLEDWITFKEARANFGPEVNMFMVDPAAELEARENLRKATEGQSNEQCKTTA